MFQLYDRTRRQICIAAFFAFCVAPTVIVLACGVWRHLPWQVDREAERLSRQLGQKVSLEGVRHLRPGVVLYEGLELSDPETGQTVLRCRLLETNWERPTGQEGSCEASLTLIASQPEIEAAQLDQFWQLVRRVLTRRAGCPRIDVRLTAGELTIRAGESSQTLTGVQGRIRTLASGTRAEVDFRLAGVEMPEPARIRVNRNCQIDPPATGFELHTGGVALPCSLLATGLPGLERLGSRSDFCGHVAANETPQGWNGQLAGRLTNVDLDRLVTGRFPHKLSGMADVTITKARIEHGRLEELAGSLAAGPGVISRSLLDASVSRLGLAAGNGEPEVPGYLVPYEQLAVAFLIDSEGLRLAAQSPQGSSRAILTGRYGPLLGEPASGPQPVVALLAMLVPLSEVQVPATRQTDWLMRHLPVPDVVPPPTADTAIPQARVSLGRGVVRP